jgi:hypothetical protein
MVLVFIFYFFLTKETIRYTDTRDTSDQQLESRDGYLGRLLVWLNQITYHFAFFDFKAQTKN